MKLIWIMTLILSVTGYGEVETENMEFTVNEAVEDIMTGDMRMNVEGNLLATTPLTVTITRSANGLKDEFCCADQCKTGNGTINEVLNYAPGGMATWFAHYVPAPGSKETISYRFDDGTDIKTITVHYDYSAQGIENVNSQNSKSRKVIRDGILYIEKKDKTYTIL